MDAQAIQPEGTQEQRAMSAYAGYDESALGVECAWPAAEREDFSTPD